MGEYNSALPNSATGGMDHNPQSTEKKKPGKRQSRHCCKNTDQRTHPGQNKLRFPTSQNADSLQDQQMQNTELEEDETA
ncbi:hypothetical protein M433DRAFT_9583 [Acidomyces richmondensis BFW]|nr:hypothetical protein M433DRAFT_9583 [Acidomyces richmondensis BFW]